MLAPALARKHRLKDAADLKALPLPPFGFLPSGRSYHVLRAKNAQNAAKAAAFASWLVAEASAGA